jgi:anti-sigma regulatory factor (Ser/Thr protein kinase)
MNAAAAVPSVSHAFRHEALLYAGEDDFIARTVAFIAGGIAHDEAALVIVSAPKIDRIRAALNGEAGRVEFMDMTKVGHNPARIIPAWYDFVARHGGGGRKLRGVGEPISAERDPAALAECHRHEALLNLAFADSGDWWLLCPYDVTTLPRSVVDEAQRNHPYILEDGAHRSSPTARDLTAISEPFADPLADPPARTPEFVFDVTGLAAVRVLVRQQAREAGLPEARVIDAVLAADEIATNSVRYGGGAGILRLWTDGRAIACEIRDEGWIDEPLIGRQRPPVSQSGGRGHWLVNQMCDLVQVRSSRAGTIVRFFVGPA